MKFCTNVYLDNRTGPIQFQGHRSKVEVTGVDLLDSLPLRDRAKSVDTITHEPLHLAWWMMIFWQPIEPYWISRS